MDSTLAPLEPVLRHSWGADTLEAFLVCQGHLKEIAARLGIHQSTVKYRLQVIRKAPAQTCLLGDRAVSVLVALRLRRLLGVEHPAAPGDSDRLGLGPDVVSLRERAASREADPGKVGQQG
jgi:hypothetical protein